MGKTIKITQKQLNETMASIEEAVDVFVNKKGTESPEQALKRTKMETEKQLGSNRDVNYVVSSEQIHESNVFTKSQIMEARRNYLNSNSVEYTKKSFIKK